VDSIVSTKSAFFRFRFGGRGCSPAAPPWVRPCSRYNYRLDCRGIWFRFPV